MTITYPTTVGQRVAATPRNRGWIGEQTGTVTAINEAGLTAGGETAWAAVVAWDNGTQRTYATTDLRVIR